MLEPMRPAERPLVGAMLVAGLAVSDDLASQLDDDNGFGDVRPADWALLRLLQRGAVSVSKLAQTLEVSQQATSKAVRDLESRDYVERLISLKDSRVHEVWLTRRGWELFAAADRWAEDHQGKAIERWGCGEVRAATSLLTGFAATSAPFSGRGRNLRAADQ